MWIVDLQIDFADLTWLESIFVKNYFHWRLPFSDHEQGLQFLVNLLSHIVLDLLVVWVSDNHPSLGINVTSALRFLLFYCLKIFNVRFDLVIHLEGVKVWNRKAVAEAGRETLGNFNLEREAVLSRGYQIFLLTLEQVGPADYDRVLIRIVTLVYVIKFLKPRELKHNSIRGNWLFYLDVYSSFKNGSCLHKRVIQVNTHFPVLVFSFHYDWLHPWESSLHL